MSLQDTIKRTQVDIPGHAYPVLIGASLLGSAGALLHSELVLPPEAKIFVIADEAVASHYLDGLLVALDGMKLAPPLLVPQGEGSKSFPVYQRVTDHLLMNGVKRDSLIIALGGGVIGDLAGFAAATVLRGLRLVQIPTTLLAQVDSAVGGKTGINTQHGKNLLGAFHHPALVLADIATLDTLPLREVKAGYAEVLKYALIGDRGFFDWLQDHGWEVVGGDVAARSYAVAVSCAAKAAVVAADPLERHGQRALLNLGHTFGHALEAIGEYDGRLLHGEAVAIGMRWAFAYAAQAGLCSPDDAKAINAHMDKLQLMSAPPFVVTVDGVLGFMRGDKKNTAGGGMTLVLPRAIGEACVARDIPEGDIVAFLRMVIKE